MKKKSLADQAYDQLLKDIISCKYWPGTSLNEDSLVGELGISRTPIHSALIRLQLENLVTIQPKKGVLVNDISPDQIRDIFNLRDLVEPHCIRRYGELFDKAKLQEFYDLFAAQYMPSEMQYIYWKDCEFHLSIVDLARNAILSSQFLLLQNILIRISNVCAIKIQKRLGTSNREHLAIIDALLRDDTESAASLMLAHLREAREASYMATKYVKEGSDPLQGIELMSPYVRAVGQH